MAKKSPRDYHTALFLDIIHSLWKLNDADTTQLAEDAEVSKSTLYNWKSGDVTRPRIDTLFKVSKQLGYEITMKKRRK